MQDTKSKLIGDVKIPFRIILKRTFKYLKPHKWKMFLALFLILLSVAIDIVVPLIYREIIDNLNSSKTFTLSVDSFLKFLLGGLTVYFTCFVFFWLHFVLCEILVPSPGTKTMPLALEFWSLNH